jgi:hypothetical protein
MIIIRARFHSSSLNSQHAIQMSVSEEQLRGLFWEDKVFGKEPQWYAEPSIDALSSVLRARYPGRTVQVAFFAQGAFNKVYQVTIQGESPLILRVSLPVDPRYKTLSEIATTR